MHQFCEEKAVDNEPEETALKKLVWYPELRFVANQWENDLLKKKLEVKQLETSVKKTKQWLKKIEKNRAELFREFLADEDQVLDAFITNQGHIFRNKELQQIYNNYNFIIIAKLMCKDLHMLKQYIWDTEKFQKVRDWEIIIKMLIDVGDLDFIKSFLKIEFDSMNEKSRDTLLEYVDSRKLVDTIIDAAGQANL